MRPSQARREAAARLRDAGVASPERDAELLLAHVLDVPLGRLPLVDDLGAGEQEQYDALLARRAAREPLQHLTGTAAFRHVELAVGPGVFVPRPETELLAGWAIEQAQRRRPGRRWSSTCAPGRARSPRPSPTRCRSADVHAVELDAPALRARPSATSPLTGVDLRLGDAFEAFDDLAGTVDVVVCNPPYIPLEAWESVAVEARDHDPHLALFSGQDGLDAMRLLERRAAALLRPGGVVGAEHADVQGDLGAGRLRGDRALARRARPPRPRGSTALHDRATGTMSGVDRLATSTEEEREAAVTAAAGAVRRGDLVVIPTDTVYGIAADAFSHEAVRRLLQAKGRGREMPPPVLVSAATTLDALAETVPPWARTLVEEFWPGPLTLVCRQQGSLMWDLGETRGTVAVRMPDDEVALPSSSAPVRWRSARPTSPAAPPPPTPTRPRRCSATPSR